MQITMKMQPPSCPNGTGNLVTTTTNNPENSTSTGKLLREESVEMNECFDHLRSLVPSIPRGETDRVKVIEHVIDYIRELEDALLQTEGGSSVENNALEGGGTSNSKARSSSGVEFTTSSAMASHHINTREAVEKMLSQIQIEGNPNLNSDR